MTDYPERIQSSEELADSINPDLGVAVVEYVGAIKKWWATASVHDRKIFVNTAFNNSKGSEEKVLTFLETVGEKDTQPYLDYYNGLKEV